MSAYTPDEQRILDELLDARGPRKAATLCQVVETEESQLRGMVRSLRMKGVVVCSNKDGFFLAQTTEQAEKTSRHLWSRVGEIAKVARAFDSARRRKFNVGFTRQEQIEIVFGSAEGVPAADELDSLLGVGA